MADPIVVTFFSSTTDLPVAGLTPSFVAPGYYETLAGVATSAPVVVDGGNGDYSFTPSAADSSTGIRYLLDGGLTASPRFYSGTIDSGAAAVGITTTTPVGVSVFGVTPANAYRRHLPQHPPPQADSNPDIDTVSEIIDECAADLEGALAEESITANAITVSNSAAYLWCRQTLRLMVMVRVLPVLQGQDSPLLKVLQADLDRRLRNLASRGYLALGSGVTGPSIQPDGPSHWIDALGLETATNDANASSVTAPFRKDDQL